MKKRFLLIQFWLLVSSIAMAQSAISSLGNRFSGMNGSNTNRNDTSNTEKESIPPKLYMWHLDEKLGTVLKMPVDTVNYNFQNSNFTGGMTGHYNFLGNLGSPRLSRVFFERRTDDHNFFIDPYSAFYVRPGELKFTNSNIPYTNISYFKGGGKEYGEERFRSYFSVNVNKHLAFGFNIDYLYGRGFYNNQSTAFFNGTLFGSYMASHYDASFIYSTNYLKMNENGGITDDRYITNPEAMSSGGKNYESQNIPTNLNKSNNRNHNQYFFFTQRYKLGFTRKIKVVPVESKDPLKKDMPQNMQEKSKVQGADLNRPPIQPNDKRPTKPSGPVNAQRDQDIKKLALQNGAGKPVRKDTLNNKKDSVITEFVPVTSFIHTLKLERTFHHFRSDDGGTFANTYIKPGTTIINDTTTYISLKNTVGIALLEGFNKYAKAGLTAYLTHKISQYKLMDADSTSIDKYSENEVFVGGELAKRQGKTLHYVINGEAGLLGKAIGQFRLNGSFDMNFHLLRDTVSFIGRANITNTLPDFYMRHYHSKHYYWDDDLNKEFRTHLEAELAIDRLQTHLKFGVENIKNYTYLNENALPTQSSSNIQVVSATFNQNFKVGIFHLDNEVIWQKSSNKSILPLPDLSLYHNLYIETKLAHKVLSVQLGADVRYFTSYDAPAYSPYIQQYTLQKSSNSVKIGSYPIVNVYANLQLKRTRFFVMYYHANAGSGNSKYFLAPHYPLNQSLFKFGLSWNFYD